jgi:hypothetical protein
MTTNTEVQQGGELPRLDPDAVTAAVIAWRDAGSHPDKGNVDRWDIGRAIQAYLSHMGGELPQDERAAFIAYQRRTENIPDFIADEVIMAGEIAKHEWVGWQAALAQRAASVPVQAVAADVTIRSFQADSDKSWWIEIRHPFGSTNKKCTQGRDIELAQLLAAPVPAASVPDAELSDAEIYSIYVDYTGAPPDRTSMKIVRAILAAAAPQTTEKP